MSAVNIPDMSVVIKAHGLIPVPVDIHTETMQPKLDQLELLASGRHALSRPLGSGESAGAAGGRVVAMLVAHLYGRRFDMKPIVDIANKYNIDVRKEEEEEDKPDEQRGGLRGDGRVSFSIVFSTLLRFLTLFGVSLFRVLIFS